jgi:hypothetical protein
MLSCGVGSAGEISSGVANFHFCVLNIPSKRNAKHGHNEKTHFRWMPRNRCAAHNSDEKA